MTAVEFRVAAFNVLANRFSRTWADRRSEVARRLTHVKGPATLAKASINLLTECYAGEADYLAGALNVATVRHCGSTIAYAKSWRLGRTWRLNWLGDTHGAIIAELTRDGVTINAVASHLPPSNVAEVTYRWHCLDRLAKFLHGWKDPTIIGGDFNWRGMESRAAALGLRSARTGPEMATTGTLRKGQAIDYVLTRNMSVRRFQVLPGWGSDHHLLSVSLTAPGGDL